MASRFRVNESVWVGWLQASATVQEWEDRLLYHVLRGCDWSVGWLQASATVQEWEDRLLYHVLRHTCVQMFNGADVQVKKCDQ
jgi:hypothetical protein